MAGMRACAHHQPVLSTRRASQGNAAPLPEIDMTRLTTKGCLHIKATHVQKAMIQQ